MGNTGRFDTQDNNKDAWVGVSSSGIHNATNTPVASEFIIDQKSAGGAHIHLGLDENSGKEIFHTERDNDTSSNNNK